MTAKHELVVRVARDYSGRIYSEIWDKLILRRHASVVIDRENGTRMNVQTIISRAKSMHELTGMPYEEDMTWPCAATLKLRCVCPRCIEMGAA